MLLLLLLIAVVLSVSCSNRGEAQTSSLPVEMTALLLQPASPAQSAQLGTSAEQQKSPLSNSSHAASLHRTVELAGTLFDQNTIFKTISISHSIPVEAAIWGLTLDDEYVYWTDNRDPNLVKRISQSSPQKVEVFAEGSYVEANVEGVVSELQISDDGRWLVYIDRSSQYVAGFWKITALHLETGEKKILFEDDGSPFESRRVLTLQHIWLDVGFDNVVLSYLLEEEANGCQRAVTRIVELETLESEIIHETDCAKDATILLWPSLEDNYLAVQKDYHDEGGGGADIALYNLETGEEQRITKDQGSVQPQVSSQYIVWKRANASEFAQSLGVYDIQTQQTTFLELPVELPRPSLSGEWLYWYPAPRELFYAYHIPSGYLELLADPTGCDTGIYGVAIGNGTAAWVRAVEGQSSLATALEWRTIGSNSESDEPLVVCWEEHSQSLSRNP